jgi:hypothetical protein
MTKEEKQIFNKYTDSFLDYKDDVINGVQQCLTTFVIYTTLKTRLANVPNNLNKSAIKLKRNKGTKFGQ